MQNDKKGNCQVVNLALSFTLILINSLSLKISHSQAKIYEKFANYFSKTKPDNKWVIVLKCTCKGLHKSISELKQYDQSPRYCNTSKLTLSQKLMRLLISRLNPLHMNHLTQQSNNFLLSYNISLFGPEIIRLMFELINCLGK